MVKLRVGVVRCLLLCAVVLVFHAVTALAAAEVYYPEGGAGACTLTHPDESLGAPDQVYATGTGGFGCEFTLFPSWQVPSGMNVSDISVYLYLSTSGNNGTYNPDFSVL